MFRNHNFELRKYSFGILGGMKIKKTDIKNHKIAPAGHIGGWIIFKIDAEVVLVWKKIAAMCPFVKSYILQKFGIWQENTKTLSVQMLY